MVSVVIIEWMIGRVQVCGGEIALLKPVLARFDDRKSDRGRQVH
ncbi:MAG: hypothetical protein ABSB67_17905 [Bryobacteraceae bacterium]